MRKLLWTASFIVSALLMLASYRHWDSFSVSEVVGFITGGYCVWLAVVQNVWNWPISIANAVAFLILFLDSKLFADAGLQVVYIILGFAGWYWWLKGGQHKNKLTISRISLKESCVLTIIGIIATIGFFKLLTAVHDVAPFWDGLTTVSSLIAQYMLIKKYFENWYVWIVTDVIYIGLYSIKHLILTSVLYVIFLTMCIIGVRDWKKQNIADLDATPAPSALNIKAEEA